MAYGDHILVRRPAYSHHGIDAGNGTVVHYTGGRNEMTKALSRVQVTALEDFALGAAIEVVKYGILDPARDAVANALANLGRGQYNLAFGNCEHFARWCKTGEFRSLQVEEKVGQMGLPVGAAAWGWFAIQLISEGGAVRGVGGSGIMSGLKSIGAPFGMGAPGGLALLALGTASLTTGLGAVAFRDDAFAEASEREARQAARRAAAGGALGTVLVEGAVVCSLNAAQLATALKVAGFGSMLRGVVVLAALPAAVGATLALAVYLFKKIGPQGQQQTMPSENGAAP